MKVLFSNESSRGYLLQGLGGDGQEFGLGFGDCKLHIGLPSNQGGLWNSATPPQKVVGAILNRTRYLNRIIPCIESQDADCHLEEVLLLNGWVKRRAIPWEIVDEGHVYSLPCFDFSRQVLQFIKRSGGVIRYEREWPGIQTQEVLRALVDFFDDGTRKGAESAYHFRMTLFSYEARAYRRKQEAVNRKAPSHNDTERPHGWRENPFNDVPFSEESIELRPVGPDGHIIV